MALESRESGDTEAEKSLEGARGGPFGVGVSHVLFLHLGAGYMGMCAVKIRVVKLCALLCM